MMKVNKSISQESLGSWREYRRAVDNADYPLGLRVARRAVEAQSLRGDCRHAGIWQRALSSVLYLQGEYDEAVREAKVAVRMQPDQYERALSLIAVANFQVYAGKFRSAFEYFARAQKIAEVFPDDLYLWSHFYGNRALAYRRTGKLDKAIIDWEGSAEMLRRHAQFSRAALYLNNIGFLLMMGGHLREAEQRVLQALELLQQEPHEHTEAVIYDSLGYVYTLMGHHTDAERFLKKSVKMFERAGDRPQLAGTLIHLADFHAQTKHYETAKEHARRALELADEIDLDTLKSQARESYERILQTELEDSLTDRFVAYEWLSARLGKARR